jgi:hypothetical protein
MLLSTSEQSGQHDRADESEEQDGVVASRSTPQGTDISVHPARRIRRNVHTTNTSKMAAATSRPTVTARSFRVESLAATLPCQITLAINN